MWNCLWFAETYNNNISPGNSVGIFGFSLLMVDLNEKKIVKDYIFGDCLIN